MRNGSELTARLARVARACRDRPWARTAAVALLAVAAVAQAVAQAVQLSAPDGPAVIPVGRAAGNAAPLILLALLATVPLGVYRPAMAAAAVTLGNAVALVSFGRVTAGGVTAELAAACWLGLAGGGAGAAGGARAAGAGLAGRVRGFARGLARLWPPGAGRYLAAGLAAPFLVIALATRDAAAVLLASAVPAAAAAGIAARAARLARTRTAAGEALADTLLAHTARGERARIARELHDVVAHHISMIAVLAETGRLTTPGLPEAGARRFAEIGDTARAGLTEMRRLLGVLRDDALADEDTGRPPALAGADRALAALTELAASGLTDLAASGLTELAVPGLAAGGGPGDGGTRGDARGRPGPGEHGTPRAASRQPQPGLRQLTALVDAAREASSAGARLIISGPVAPLDPGVELAAYRIVQEALTNVRRHAPGAAVDVELRYSPGSLRLRVRDNGPGLAGRADPGGRPAGAGQAARGLASNGDPARAGGALAPNEALARAGGALAGPAGGGHGLAGMRERAFSAGGSLYTGVAPGGGFLVEAVLPADLEAPRAQGPEAGEVASGQADGERAGDAAAPEAAAPEATAPEATARAAKDAAAKDAAGADGGAARADW